MLSDFVYLNNSWLLLLPQLDQPLHPGLIWIYTDFLLLLLRRLLLHQKPAQIGNLLWKSPAKNLEKPEIATVCNLFLFSFFHSHNSSDVAIAICFLVAQTFNVSPRISFHLGDISEAAVAIGAWRETQMERTFSRTINTLVRI